MMYMKMKIELEPTTEMNTTVPNFILIEADNWSKTTKLPFRDCLEILFKSYLKGLTESKSKIGKE